MILGYFSWSHILYIAAALAIVAALYLLFRKKSERAQKYLVLTLAVLNVIQHIFKMYIYPLYEPGFSYLTTAYNMCASLILLSPFALLIKSEMLRDFVFYIGSAAGAVALLIPYWNIGTPAFSWEMYRFFICHALLFASSILPLLFGHHRPSWKCFYKLPLCFFVVVAAVILNDIICVFSGLFPEYSVNELYLALKSANPVWSFGPPESFSFVLNIARALSPNILVGDNPTGLPVPILWYFIPVYLGIMIIALPVCAAVDRENFKTDMARYRERLSALFAKIKSKLKKQ